MQQPTLTPRVDRPAAWLLRPSLAAAATLLLGCQDGTTFGRDDWETVFRITPNSAIGFTAAPDGTLFVAAGDALFRRRPLDGCVAVGGDPASGPGLGSEAGCWERVASTPEPILQLYAPSRDEVFALPRPNLIYHWRSGSARMDTMRHPLTDSVISDGHYRRGIFVLALGGRAADDVYAVGEEGSILRFDGRRWVLEPNPLVPRPGSRPTYADDFFSLGVAGGEVFAGAAELLVRGPGGWRVMPRPDTVWAPGTILAIAESSGRLVVGGGGGERLVQPFLAVREDGTWRDLTPAIRGFKDVVRGGGSSADGSALFWSSFGDLARVSGGTARAMKVPLRVDAAAMSGGRIYVAGVQGNEHVVVRSRKP